MKDKLKNTLEHEVELLGRSISILAITALLLIGGGSAALLTSFGTVSGDASVDQAVTFEGEADSATKNFGFTGYAGETSVDTYTLESNTEAEATVEFWTQLSYSDKTEDTTSYAHQWASGDHGDFETDVVNYFDEANHKSYQQPEGPDYTVSTVSELSDFVKGSGDYSGISSGESVEIKAGTYDLDSSDFEPDRVMINQASDIHVYSEVDNGDRATLQADREDGTAVIDIRSSGATVEGFEIDYTNDEGSSWAQGIAVRASKVDVFHNNVDYTHGDKQKTVGIVVVDDGGNVDGVDIEDNSFDGAYSGTMISTYYGYSISDVDIKSNTFDSENAAVVKAHDGNSFPTSISFTENNLEGEIEDLAIPDADTYAGENTASVSSSEVSASDNFFANGVPEGDALSSASYKSLGDTLTIDPNSGETVGVIHRFPINLEPDTYSFTTEVRPVTE